MNIAYQANLFITRWVTGSVSSFDDYLINMREKVCLVPKSPNRLIKSQAKLLAVWRGLPHAVPCRAGTR